MSAFINENGSPIRMSVLKELIKDSNNYVENVDNLPFISEITSNIRPLIINIIKGIRELEPENNISLILGWCFYAGLGATMLWNINWSQLNKKGVYNALTEERGIFEMDEYVLDLIGLPFESKEAQKLTEHLQESSMKAIVLMAKFSIDKSQDVVSNVFLETCEAMYWYGMVIQMNRIGYK